MAADVPPLRSGLRRRLASLSASRRERAALRRWESGGRSGPPPALAKRALLAETGRAYGLRCLVETGTYLGDTVEAMRSTFDRVVSVELSEPLHGRARQRFAGVENVTLLQGDSGDVLAELVPTLRERCLFWLDGHYSAGFTALGELETPIVKELEAVFASPVPGHVVLIDDARCFTGADGWPSLDELRELTARLAPDYGYRVEDDIVRIMPERA